MPEKYRYTQFHCEASRQLLAVWIAQRCHELHCAARCFREAAAMQHSHTKSVFQFWRCSSAVCVWSSARNLISETCQSNMTLSHFERFHVSGSSRLLWPVLGRLPTQIKWLCSHFLSTSSVRREKPAGFDRAAPSAMSNHLLWENIKAAPEAFLTQSSGLCNSRRNFLFFFLLLCVENFSNCMLCTVLRFLPLPHPRRTHLLRLLFSQSTPLPPAQPLTRWRGHLQQVVVVPTQDLL